MVQSGSQMPQRPRVVIALPDVTESGAVADWLADEGFDCIRRATLRSAADEIRTRPFDLLISDSVFAFSDGLYQVGRGRNPSTPIVVVGDARAAEQCASASWAMHVARPIDCTTLVCTVSMALLDGRPQRRSPRKAVNRFEAVVNGVPAHIIDISNEGVRLEMPREGRGVLPPYFTVRVPLLGVGVRMQRMWARPMRREGNDTVTWCGGALTANPSRAEGGWRAFVDTVPVASTAQAGHTLRA
jgi:hypothetical protein